MREADGWAWQFPDLPKYAGGELVTYTITEDAVNHYTAQVQGHDVANAYEPPQPPDPPTPTYPTLRVPLSVKKTLRNGSLKAGAFTFQLKDRQGNVIEEASNAADGTVTFSERTFSREVSNWIYTIHEVQGTDPKMRYDSTVFTVKITTTAVGGMLEAKVSIEKDGNPVAGEMTFVNQLEMPPTGDRSYLVLGLLLGASVLMMGGAYVISRRRRKEG